MLRKVLAVAVATILLSTSGLLSTSEAGAAQAQPTQSSAVRPIVFVHGFSGGAQQYETQARRFASNGYPASFIEAHEYDSTFVVNTTARIFASLDERIAALLTQTGADQVDLTAHSLGTA